MSSAILLNDAGEPKSSCRVLQQEQVKCDWFKTAPIICSPDGGSVTGSCCDVEVRTGMFILRNMLTPLRASMSATS